MMPIALLCISFTISIYKEESINTPDECFFVVDTTLRYYQALCWQRSPAVAYDGTNWLVVWEETCNSLLPYFYYYDIRYARISSEGVLIDSSELAISYKYGFRGRPAVAYCEPYYLVVYQELDPELSSDLYCTRITKTGTVIDDPGIVVSAEKGNQHSPILSTDMENFLVVWIDERNNSSDIYGTRITKDCKVLDTHGIEVCLAPGAQSSPSIANGGDKYLVVWADKRNKSSDIYGTFISNQGSTEFTNGFVISADSTDEITPSVASDGNKYIVIWGVCNRIGNRRYPLATYDVYGTVLDRRGKPIVQKAIVSKKVSCVPSIVFRDNNFYLIFDKNNILILTVKKEELRWENINKKQKKDFSSHCHSLLIAWTDCRLGSQPYRYSDIWAKMVNNYDTQNNTDFLVSMTANIQLTPALAYDGTNYLVVWSEYTGFSYDLYGMRLSQYGTQIDSSTILISAAVGDQGKPAVCFGKQYFLVVWQDSRNGDQNNDIFGTLVDKEGRVLNKQGISITSATGQQYSPAVSYDGTNFFVVWEDLRDLATAFDIFGSRISETGKVIDQNGIAICRENGAQRLPAISFDGDNFLVVWRDERSSPGNFEIYGTRVSPSGETIDKNSLRIATEGSSPSITFDGTNYVVVWESRIDSKVLAARVTPSGLLLDTAGVCVLGRQFKQEKPHISNSGNHYLVTWQEKNPDSTWNICAAKITPRFNLIDFIIIDMPGNQMYPVGYGNPERNLIIYSGFTKSIKKRRIETMRTRCRIW